MNDKNKNANPNSSCNPVKGIFKLPEETINKIAAAESLDSPVAIIKELIDNSFDANAQRVNISLSKDLVTKMTIEDNGNGIPSGSLILSLERFTTSKIKKIEDLRSLCTAGFRGEGLFLISQVCNLQVISRHHTEQLASSFSTSYKQQTKKNATKGNQAALTVVPREIGTTVILKNLFHNFSIREAFLKANKKKVLEKCANLVKRLSVHFWEKDVVFNVQDMASFAFWSVGNASRLDALHKVYGLKKDVFEVRYSRGAISKINKSYKKSLVLNDDSFEGPKISYLERLEGILSRPNFKGAPCHEIVFFVNDRLTSLPGLAREIKELYRELKANRLVSPFVFLSISVDPTKIDVNVDPKKAFIVFENEREVFSEIIRLIRVDLEKELEKTVVYAKPFSAARNESFSSTLNNYRDTRPSKHDSSHVFLNRTVEEDRSFMSNSDMSEIPQVGNILVKEPFKVPEKSIFRERSRPASIQSFVYAKPKVVQEENTMGIKKMKDERDYPFKSTREESNYLQILKKRSSDRKAGSLHQTSVHSDGHGNYLKHLSKIELVGVLENKKIFFQLGQALFVSDAQRFFDVFFNVWFKDYRDFYYEDKEAVEGLEKEGVQGLEDIEGMLRCSITRKTSVKDDKKMNEDIEDVIKACLNKLHSNKKAIEGVGVRMDGNSVIGFPVGFSCIRKIILGSKELFSDFLFDLAVEFTKKDKCVESVIGGLYRKVMVEHVLINKELGEGLLTSFILPIVKIKVFTDNFRKLSNKNGNSVFEKLTDVPELFKLFDRI